MENLIIKPKGQIIPKQYLGALWIILGFITLLAAKGPLEQKDWLRATIFLVIGSVHFTPLIGSSVSKIEIGDGCLKILWLNWILSVTIRDSEIEGIILADNGISIKRKDRKPVKIKFMSMDFEQKQQVYDFFTAYAREKNFILG